MHEADKKPGNRPPPSNMGWSVIPERRNRDTVPPPEPQPEPAQPKLGPHARPSEPTAPRDGRPAETTVPKPSPDPPPPRPHSVRDDYPGKENLRYLTLPDGLPDPGDHRSPPVTAFKDPLPLPPVAKPEPEPPVPAPDGRRHQLFDQYKPEKYYQARETEFRTRLHSDYGEVTWTWGVDGSRPGPTIHARYGEPILIRRHNQLPLPGTGNIDFATPSTTRHTGNGHQADDGDPDEGTEPGDFTDHHFADFPATIADPRSGKRIPDEREKLTTLWYHDHRRGATAANGYAGLLGAHLCFDDQDSGDENDPNPYAWRLPSGEHDQPLLLQDLRIDRNRQLLWEPRDTDGMLGDRFTVNGVIQPHSRVKRRKYRFRLINASVSRFYDLNLNFARNDTGLPADDRFVRMVVITGDGHLLPEPLEAERIVLAPGQRVDVVVDFSAFTDGDLLFLENRLDQTDGRGPSGRRITDPAEIRRKRIMRFDVSGGEIADPSRIPDFFRPFPEIDDSQIVRKRRWRLDHGADGFTVDGDASDDVTINTAEQWTFHNVGDVATHPVHAHLGRWLVKEINGVPVEPDMVQIAPRVRGVDDFQRVFTRTDGTGGDYVPGTNVLRGPFCGAHRRDVALLAPATSLTMYCRWPDFSGRYALHATNLVHADAAMTTHFEVVPR